MRYHFTLAKMAIVKKTENKKCWQGCTEVADGDVKWCACCENRLAGLKKKLHMELPCDEQFHFWVYPKEIRNRYSNKQFSTNIP